MILIVVLASFSLSFTLKFEKPRVFAEGNTTVSVLQQILENVPVITQSKQFVGLIKDFVELQNASKSSLQMLTNAVCSSAVGTGGLSTVARALDITCAEEDGYEIQLKNTVHTENLVINVDSTILIKGLEDSGSQTIWNAEPLSSSQYTIEQMKGKLTLQDIDFGYVMTSDGSNIAAPTGNLICVHSTSDPYPYITIQNCHFKGIGFATNSMVYVDGASSVQITDSSFSSPSSIEPIVKATGYSSFKVSNSEFTDINGGDVGGIYVQNRRVGNYDIAITSNTFSNCKGRFFWSYQTLNLNNNYFSDNIKTTSTSDGDGRDAHIYKRNEDGLSDPIREYKEAFQGSSSNYPKSVLIEIPESVSNSFSLRSNSGKCWDTILEPEYFIGCICTASGHPSECTCPTNDPQYTLSQCQQDKGIVVPPEQCKGSGDKSGCICTLNVHPSACVCPTDDSQFSKDKCLYDKLPQCTSDTTPAGGCKCASSRHPTDCTCPTDDPNYSPTKCQEDKQPVTPDKCDPITATTPEI
ncbi:MAG: hypothetical protein EZS28_024744 [Streblomastix strix]|uniref:Right handed beta helix domain-containing protein n=1 Tax=Streblomastix strix TaxID=222440 RepID=A0A5J4VAY3_9EUKA|nr:MAG: hypothetical protein EZS28_024744 [Streblomastix strix]